jgi:hypothetical protein
MITAHLVLARLPKPETVCLENKGGLLHYKL